MQIRQLKFDPITHTYRDEYEDIYTSVTQRIQVVTPAFNKDYWASFKARQRGVSKEVILAEWANITSSAIDRGNAIHEEIEDNILESRVGLVEYKPTGKATDPMWGYSIDLSTLIDINFHKNYPEIFNLICLYVNDGWKLYAEKRIYSSDHYVAGTIDLLLVKDGEFIIVDWKTNKDGIKFKSGYYKKIDGIKTNIWVDKKEYMLRPVNTLEHCKGTVYTLQLSLYAAIGELWGFKCRGLILFHIGGLIDGNKIFTRYNIKYDKASAMKLLTVRKNPPITKEVPFLLGIK